MEKLNKEEVITELISLKAEMRQACSDDKLLKLYQLIYRLEQIRADENNNERELWLS